MSDPCLLNATEQVALIRDRQISCRELLTAHLQRIERLNPHLNAIVSLVPEAAIARAEALDAGLARGEAPGPLTGLPIAHKDLVPTAGLRTTFGSPIFAEHVPVEDALIVARLRAAGSVLLGKTNTPEFGAGSHTFNRVFGITRNPYDTARTCGGSSGGAAVALAARLLPIADGSDLGGSLRNPAAFNNVVGLRPTPGRVPIVPNQQAWQTMSVQGPMARCVDDCALLFAAMAGPDARSPIALETPGSAFHPLPEADTRGFRVAFSADLDGLPLAAEVRTVVEAAARRLANVAHVDAAWPDLSGADDVFHVLRAHTFAHGFSEHVRTRREQVKASIIWNVEQGLALSALDVARAEHTRSVIFQRVAAFFERYDFLACTTTQVTPFPVEVEYPTSINDQPMHSYLEWMRSCSRISVLNAPAISVPAGFTATGLPVGLQLIGRRGGELALLQLARAFEATADTYRQRPPDA